MSVKKKLQTRRMCSKTSILFILILAACSGFPLTQSNGKADIAPNSNEKILEDNYDDFLIDENFANMQFELADPLSNSNFGLNTEVIDETMIEEEITKADKRERWSMVPANLILMIVGVVIFMVLAISLMIGAICKITTKMKVGKKDPVDDAEDGTDC